MAHFLAEVERLEDLDAELHQLVQEIVGGTDVVGEIRIGRGGRIGVGDFARRELTLGMMEGQRAQVVRGPTVGADDDVGHGRAVGFYAVVIREICL